MLNKRSIHVLMNSSKKFIRCLLNQSFLCCPAILVDVSDIQQMYSADVFSRCIQQMYSADVFSSSLNDTKALKIDTK